jgi:acetolactate synthase-1/2/3 large subunit
MHDLKAASNAIRERQGQMVSGAEATVLCLLHEGVDTIFGYPGGAIMPVYDALHGYTDALTHILGRHEQGAIHAAQGYARAARRTGVVIATSGPGATNLVTGIADAYMDSTPLVCITGQVPSHLLGKDAFQETDVINVTSPVTKWNIQVSRACDIPGAIARAFFIARSGRPGPVLVDITKDAQNAELEFSYTPCTGLRSYVSDRHASDDAIKSAAEVINSAKKPLLIAGQGVVLSGAEMALLAVAEKTGIPVAWTLLGLDAFPTGHPLSVGMVGMHGKYGANIKTNECDVLIGVGMRFDDRVTGDPARYAAQAKVVHLEIDPAEINKIIPAAVPVLGDARDSLQRLLDHLNEGSHPEWMAEFRACDVIEDERVIQAEVHPTGPELRMGEAIRLIAEHTHGKAVIVSDVGQHQMMAARYSRYEARNTSITSGGLGTMGFALPAAIGAKIGVPEKTVVAVIGDGGFQMTLQELGMIMQTRAAVKIVILNKSFLGMVRQWQELFFDGRYSATEMENPDFVVLASAYGIKASRVSERAHLEDAIVGMLEHPGPYLLDVVVEQQGNVFPMVPSGASVSDISLGGVR